MRYYCLIIGLIASAISGAVCAVIGVVGLFDGQIFGGLASIFIAAPMSFAMMYTFSYVLEQIESGEDSEGDTSSRRSTTANPTSDTAGTPWANDPGATEER